MDGRDIDQLFEDIAGIGKSQPETAAQPTGELGVRLGTLEARSQRLKDLGMTFDRQHLEAGDSQQKRIPA